MPGMPKRSAGEVLLELLDHVPAAATLELLLEPEVLHPILRAKGWTDDDIRSDLAARSPGELLLDVLRQDGDTTALLAIAGRTPPVPGDAAPRAPSAAASSPKTDAGRSAASPPASLFTRDAHGPRLDAFTVHTPRERVGGLTILIAATILSMLASGVFPEWTTPLGLTLAVGAALGALGGAIFGSVRRAVVLGGVCGAVAVMGSVLAVHFLRRIPGLPGTRLELILAVVVGFLPAALVYAVAVQRRTREL